MDDQRPFECSSGVVDFMLFEYRLSVLLQYSEKVSRFVEEFVQSEVSVIARELASYHGPMKYEYQMALEEDFGFLEQCLPEYVRYSVLVLTMSLVEALLSGVCRALTERGRVCTVNKSTRQEEGTIIALAEAVIAACGFPFDLDSEDTKVLTMARKLRNSYLHTLGEDYHRQDRIGSPGSALPFGESVPELSPEFCRQLLSTSGRIVSLVEDAVDGGL